MCGHVPWTGVVSLRACIFVAGGICSKYLVLSTVLLDEMKKMRREEEREKTRTKLIVSQISACKQSHRASNKFVKMTDIKEEIIGDIHN